MYEREKQEVLLFVLCVCVSVPSILPTDSVTVLRMLWEGDVDSNQRRAVLQHHATSNHCHATVITKTGSGERKRCRHKERER